MNAKKSLSFSKRKPNNLQENKKVRTFSKTKSKIYFFKHKLCSSCGERELKRRFSMILLWVLSAPHPGSVN